MTVAGRKRHKYPQHQATERRKHTQAKFWTLTPIFSLSLSLSRFFLKQRNCFTWAVHLFPEFYLCFMFLFAKNLIFTQKQNMTPLWHWIPSIFFSASRLAFNKFSMTIHCHSESTTMNFLIRAIIGWRDTFNAHFFPSQSLQFWHLRLSKYKMRKKKNTHRLGAESNRN